MKKRELVLIMILLVLLCGSGYYFFYFAPSGNRIAGLKAHIDQQQSDIDAAMEQVAIWAALSNTRNEIEGDWSGIAGTIPEEFDEADILKRIQRIILPHTKNVNIKFSDKGNKKNDKKKTEDDTGQPATENNTVEITFVSSYSTLQEVLGLFGGETIANRIINISCVETQDTGGAEAENTGAEDVYTVFLSVDFLTRSPVPATEE